ncbi:MAG: hypothetical protein GY925_10390 [Actinomycetia bacterium]|nr:hypothetical protein [Actinomycetes bacterium]
MADIGDDYTISTTITVDDVNINPAAITLTVTDPADVPTTPSVNNPAVGEYNGKVSLDQAGRWLWKWETVTPTGVDWGYVDVDVDPPARRQPLATVADLEGRVGALTAAQLARAPALLSDASDLIRAETKLDFTLVEDEVATLRSNGNKITLPKRPVSAVSSVTAVGVPPTSNFLMPVGTWAWDQIDKIEIHSSIGWVINLPEVWAANDWAGSGTYIIVYSHGEAIVPGEIVGLVCGMVNRTLTAPAISELVSESIGSGDYSWQAQQGTGAMGVGVRLTAGDRNMLKRWGYLQVAGTSEMVIR